MATEILATGSATANSSTFTLAEGETATLFLKGQAGTSDAAFIHIQIEDSAAAYHTIGYLSFREPAKVLQATGTYRVRRVFDGFTVGVERG